MVNKLIMPVKAFGYIIYVKRFQKSIMLLSFLFFTLKKGKKKLYKPQHTN